MVRCLRGWLRIRMCVCGTLTLGILKVKHVVMFSGGIGSWMTAKRVIERCNVDDVVLLFADVAGDRNRCNCGHLDNQHINGRGPCDVKSDDKYCGCTRWVETTHVGEDQDTYRFIKDAQENLGAELVVVKDSKGRDIWSVYHTRRFLGNSRQANCSIELKQKPCLEWLKSNCSSEDTVVYVGIDWTESHRLPAIQEAYGKHGYTAEAPLCDAPFLDKADMIEAAEREGLKPPRAYAMGYPHNNCGGFCVRAGKGQFKMLLDHDRERYMFHENREIELRKYLEKPVTILRENTGGKRVNLTLRSYRERIESQPDLFGEDDFDLGGCGCFSQFED